MKLSRRMSLSLVVVTGLAVRALGGTFEISQNHADALYRAGEEAVFHVTYRGDDGACVTSGTVNWTLDNFGSDRLGRGTVDLAKGNPFVVRGKLDRPDFLRLTVSAGPDRRVWSVGYDVEKIRQDVPVPADFDDYWQGEKARLAREVPLDPACERIAREKGYDTYRISFATFNGRRIYGFMTIPTDRSLYPARVRIRVCDGGPGCRGPWEANAGEITATLNVHAFAPVADEAGQKALLAEQNRRLGLQWNLRTNAYNTAIAGIDGARGDYFFHDAMLGIARAVDWIIARPEADPTRVTYFGSSQGGGFGLYVTYLNGHFTRAFFAVPAITGHFGKKSRRQNGWPGLLDSIPADRRAKAEANAPYYDGVSFASRLTIPVRFAVGFSDTTCPPPDVYAAFNVCPSKDKAILNCIGCAHSSSWYLYLGKRAKTDPFYDYNGWLRAPNRPARKTLALDAGEQWYGAATVLGEREPFSAANGSKLVDLRKSHGAGIGGNQAAPLLLSNQGRWVWCERPFSFQFTNGVLTIEADRADAAIETGKSGDTLRSAYLHCSKAYFPPQGTPKLEWFRNPIINTWASLGYMQKQESILELARGFKDMGVPPGVFMIDHGWHELPMGTWDFNLRFIPDPKGMVREMKEKLGYSAVILWFDNHVAMESLHYREIFRKGYTLKSAGRGYQLSFISQWWAGWGAVLDCTNPECFEYTKNRLHWLMDTYGVDGFFFDAGDPDNFIDHLGCDKNVARPFDPKAAPSDMTRAYHLLGTTVPYQQHRASWKMGGLALKQTERDKAPTFEALRMCLSNGIVAGLIGYPFIDFDMVGGGLFGPTQKDRWPVFQQQFVRSMQVQCLSPMVQLSIPPWKVLDAEHLAAFKKAIALRQKWAPYIVETAVASGKTGEPMMRSLEYSFPGNGYATVMDEFLMGDRLLVAPQIVENAATRKVLIPPGTWKGDAGEVVTGPTEIEVKTPLDRLPHFELTSRLAK